MASSRKPKPDYRAILETTLSAMESHSAAILKISGLARAILGSTKMVDKLDGIGEALQLHVNHARHRMTY